MIAYPQFKLMVDIAEGAYPKLYYEVKKLVDENKPSHEIVDNYGLDIEEIANKIIPIENGENDNG